MPETEGRVTCELVGDATVNALKLKVFTIINYMPSFIINTYCCGYVEIKCRLDATEVFIADLIACSTCFGHHYAHHQELESIIQRLLPVVFRAVVSKLLVWCGAEGYVSGLQDAAALCKPDTPVQRC